MNPIIQRTAMRAKNLGAGLPSDAAQAMRSAMNPIGKAAYGAVSGALSAIKPAYESARQPTMQMPLGKTQSFNTLEEAMKAAQMGAQMPGSAPTNTLMPGFPGGLGKPNVSPRVPQGMPMAPQGVMAPGLPAQINALKQRFKR